MNTYIKLYIDFCYADLKIVSVSERKRLFDDLIGYVYQLKPLSISSGIPIPPLDNLWPLFRNDQKIAHNFLEWIYQNKGQDFAVSLMVPHIFTSGGGDPNEKFNFVESHYFIYYSEKMTSLQVSHDIQLCFFKMDEPGKMILNGKYPFFVMLFMKAIHNKHVDSILRCPKCSKIFFNPTKRKQVYCGAKCRGLAGVHRARKKTSVRKNK